MSPNNRDFGLPVKLVAGCMLTAEWRDDVTMLVQVKWITFHSGYDFGYLLKVLTCQPLPKTEVDFFELLKVKHRPVSCYAGPDSP